MLNRSNLSGYQNTTVEYIKEKKKSFLIMKMGGGKTVSTLTAVADLFEEKKIFRVLIIAPLRVAKTVWKQEAKKWQHLQHLDAVVVAGLSEKKRIEVLKEKHQIYIINRENVPWLVEKLKRWPFDYVVIDESSSFKNQKSKRFKALKKVIPESRYTTLLTGTPSPNCLSELWPQCYLVDHGRALGKTFTNFKNRFFHEVGYMGYQMELNPGADKIIHKLIEPFTLSIAPDYQSAGRRDVYTPVSLPKKVMDDYQQFEKDLLKVYESGEVIEAANSAVLANKLLQYCSGACYLEDQDGYKVVHDEKIKALDEIVEDNAGENLLIAYNYKSDLERLQRHYPDAVVLDKDPETVERWNRGEIKMLLAHPASAGHGLNLQNGGSIVVWFTLCWSLEYYLQFNARLDRQGQKNMVSIIHIIAAGCLDERIVKVLNKKDANQNALIASLVL